MSSFTSFEGFNLKSGILYQADSSTSWEIGSKGSGWVLYLTKGETFDISVPMLLRWALSPHDRNVLMAAWVHDKLLKLGHDAAFSSAEFRRAAIARGKSTSFAWALFFATLAYTAFFRK